MADKNGYDNFPDFDVSEIFTDIRTHSTEEELMDRKVNKQKFVVHIDDSLNDSFEYDFAAFSDPESRQNEEARKAESRRSFEKLEEKPSRSPAAPAEKRKAVPAPVGRKQKNRADVSARPVPEEKKRSSEISTPAPVQRPRQSAAPVKEVPSVQEKPIKQVPENVDVPEEKPVVRMKTRSRAGALTGLIGFVCIVVAVTLILTSVGFSTIGDIVAYNRDEQSVTVVIENEKNGNSPTLDHVIDALHSAGLIKQKALCKFFAKFRHFDGYTNRENVWVPTEYLSGIYYLEPRLGLEGMLNTIKKSSAGGEYTVTLTFPEGWTISQIFERLEKNGVCEQSKLYANIEAVAKQYDFYLNINQSGLRYLGVEGYLFPDTYEFYKNENAVSVLRKLFDNSDAKWKKSYSKRAKELGYTRDEILIIASIIQREAANSSQMADVSSVLHNRLKSPTYPSIQCNSTIDYVTNSVKSHVDASLAEVYTNAYNTYRVEGLPPGPICNPGIDDIVAALNPSDTDYYFFVHNNNGKIYLSSTYAQFQKDCVQVTKDNA